MKGKGLGKDLDVIKMACNNKKLALIKIKVEKTEKIKVGSCFSRKCQGKCISHIFD